MPIQVEEGIALRRDREAEERLELLPFEKFWSSISRIETAPFFGSGS